MNPIVTKLMGEFSDRHFASHDFVAFRLLLKRLKDEKNLRQGQFKREFLTQDGKAILCFYYDAENDQIHSLAAYLDRKGEPKPSLTKDILTYIRNL
jgi:hypothetical protein